MDNTSKKIIYGIMIFVVILSIIFALKKETYSINDDAEYIGTREDLQNMVVATALSYLYNNEYSDYEQYTMTGPDAKGFRWVNFNNSPEMVSRSNLYNTKCGGFGSIVNLYSLGYDYSRFYEQYNFSYYIYDKTENKIVSRNMKSSQANYQKGYLTLGQYQAAVSVDEEEQVFMCTHTASNANINSDDENGDVYDDEIQASGSSPVICGANLKEHIAGKLQSGDILWYRKQDNNGNISGHVMMYVGDIFKNGEYGFIHSVGKDTFKNDVYNPNGEDKYSVRYDTLDGYVQKYVFDGENIRDNIVSISILRPINHYCIFESGNEKTSDQCTINSDNITSLMHKGKMELLIKNSKARSELSNMRIEQYQFLYVNSNDTSNILNNYNSVNVGDKITYRLVLTDKNQFSYCTYGNFDNKTDCINNHYEWKTTNWSTKEYKNLKVTAKIPEGTQFSSCYINVNGSRETTNCSVDTTEGTITWDSKSFEVGTNNIVFGYRVKTLKNGIVTNPGMTITTENNNVLQMGELITHVNSTINSSENVSSIQTIMNNIAKAGTTYSNNTGLSYVRNIYFQYLYNGQEYTFDEAKNAFPELDKYIDIREALFIKNYGSNNRILRRPDCADSYNLSLCTNFSSADDTINDENRSKYKRINDMLVPGEYGGRNLSYNIAGDRARILYKNNGYKQTLEVGDVILAIISKEDFSVDTTNSRVWIFYGYDDNNQPIFYRSSFQNNVTNYYRYDANGSHKWNSSLGTNGAWEDIDSSETGYALYKKIYDYQLFAVLRPTRVYNDYSNIDAQLVLEVSSELMKKDEEIPYIKNKEMIFDKSINSFMNKLSVPEGIDKILLDNNFQSITGREEIRTGDVVRISKSQDNYKDYIILIRGDVTSDGKIDHDDAVSLAKDIIDKSSGIEEKYLLAGDMNDNSKIKMNDVMTLLKLIG